jgi:hypothetical protein
MTHGISTATNTTFIGTENHVTKGPTTTGPAIPERPTSSGNTDWGPASAELSPVGQELHDDPEGGAHGVSSLAPRRRRPLSCCSTLANSERLMSPANMNIGNRPIRSISLIGAVISQ